MKQFYFHNGSEQLGPYEIEELKQKGLKRNTPVWYDGLEDWTSAENIDELKALFVNTPPPFTNMSSTPPPLPPQSAITHTPTEEYPFEEQKKSFTKPAVVVGAILLAVGLIGWLTFQNQEQKETLAVVQQQVTEQETKINEKEQIQQEKLEEQKQKTEALIKKNSEFRNNWQNYIRLKDIKYSYSALGGIDAFDFSVSNETDYVIDEVSVDINYIKASGGLYDTKTVVFENIQPHSEKSGNAPSSPRGTKVSADILYIHSDKMHFCFPNDNPNALSNDPYYCK